MAILWLNLGLTTPLGLLRGPALAVLVLAALACNSQATATPAPTLIPTVLPTATAEPKVLPEPTPSPTTFGEIGPPYDGGSVETPYFFDYWHPFYGKPTYGGSLRVGFDFPLEHANVWGAAYGPADMYRVPTGATLVMEDPYDAGGPVIPDLAAEWEIHEGHDGVTFHFREGTTWHSGELFACEDARFSLQTMITGNGLTSSYMQGHLDHIEVDQMVCFDNARLEIKFDGPTAIPLHAFSHYRALVFNKAWFLQGGEDAMFADASVGIGPFKWAEGQRVGIDAQHFERNPDYFLPELPYVDELVIYGILEDSARQAAHLAHQTDWVWIHDWRGDWNQQYQAYVDHDQIMTVIRPTRGNLRLWINPRNPPFDNIMVRQAIVTGIDREAIIREIQKGYGSVGGFGYPPGSRWELPQDQLCSLPGWCVSEDMEATRAEASEILQVEGFDFDRTYTFSVSSDHYELTRATFIQEQLRLLGVRTDFDVPRQYETANSTGRRHFPLGRLHPSLHCCSRRRPYRRRRRLFALRIQFLESARALRQGYCCPSGPGRVGN